MGISIGVPPTIVTTICLLILAMSFSSRATRTCPLSCRCLYTNDGTVAKCNNPLMDKIPMFSASTWSVNLQHTTVLTVGDDVFKTAANMDNLRFTSCKMSRVTTGSLNGLQRLRSFGIFALPNFPVTLERSVLSNLTSLISLSIIRNNLQYFPFDRLCELPLNSKVNYLSLRQNKITHLRMNICIQSHLPDLHSLNLKANPLVSLSGDDFKPLGNAVLGYLVITGTHIETIEPDVLKYIPKLEDFTIASDRLESLPDGMFSTANISSLMLSGKNIQFIPQDIGLARSIKSIHLTGSRNTQVSFGAHYQAAVNLRTLQLSYISSDVISGVFFQNLINSPVEQINLQRCKIESICLNTFEAFSKSLQRFYFKGRHNSSSNPSHILTNISMALINATNLNIFSFRYTRTKDLNKYTFRGFSNSNIISVLKLSNNNISSIDSDTFAPPFTQLKQLDLGENKRLTNDGLKEGCFSGLIQLEYLSLQSNSFRQIPVCSHVKLLPSLKILDMRENDLELLTAGNFAGYYNLEKLFLDRNRIKSIKNALVNLTQLVVLNISNNALTMVFTDDFKTLTHLQTLVLYKNKLSSQYLESLHFLFNINYLHLSFNRYFCSSQHCGSMFQNLKQLSTLKLGSTRLLALESNMFLGLHNLQFLVLSLNMLSYIHPDVFVPLRNLTDLILTNNRLTTFMLGTFRHLISLRNLKLQGNPFTCNCEMFWFSQWMISTDVNVQDITVKHEYRCSNPQAQRNKDLLDFMANSDCIYTDLTTPFTIYISLLVVCMLISMTYRYRWHLRYNLYKLKYKKMDIHHRHCQQFAYDAFVCYHYSSMKWIIEKMIPELESKHGMKLCIHHRDWPAGEAIVDNIMNSIQQSRTTVFIVNKSFAQSLWGREEVDMAYAHFVNDRRNSIIVILMENIENGMVNRSLRNLLTSKTYLPWKPGGKKEFRFWKTLTKTLKIYHQQDEHMATK